MVRVVEAERGREHRRFLDLPWDIYRGDPWWVPPLKSEVAGLLDVRHPFFRNAERALFLALEGDRPVGRIAAIVNRAHDRFHGEKAGFFGFFESVNDPQVAAALLGAAERHLAQRGAAFVRGPMDPSTNEVCGLLVEGHASPPFLMMPYQPTYYAALLEGAGYRKAKDLWAFLYELAPQVPPRLARLSDRILDREKGLRIRSLEMKDFPRELERIRLIYNDAWERNWGFVPMIPEEFTHMAKQLRPLVVPELVQIAEVGDEPVGFLMSVPDYNLALRLLDGRFTPWGLVRFLAERRRIRTFRLMTMGMRAAWRKRGLDAVLFARSYQEARRLGYRYCEFSWILEDNLLTHRSAELFGAFHYKTYRIYERTLGPGASPGETEPAAP
jgi:hypothetical protein